MSAKIAIIDDDDGIRATLQDLLRSLDYTVDKFSSAEEFLNSVNIKETSCIISDIRMSGISGIDLQSRLIAQERRIPIIFITAFPEDGIRERVLKAGAYGFLPKPFQQSKLVDCLTRALQA